MARKFAIIWLLIIGIVISSVLCVAFIQIVIELYHRDQSQLALLLGAIVAGFITAWAVHKAIIWP